MSQAPQPPYANLRPRLAGDERGPVHALLDAAEDLTCQLDNPTHFARFESLEIARSALLSMATTLLAQQQAEHDAKRKAGGA